MSIPSEGVAPAAREVRPPRRPGPAPWSGPTRGPKLKAAGLTLPLVGFIVLVFVAPLASLLTRSFHDPVVAEALPETLGLLRDWDGRALPGDDVYAALGRDLARASEERAIGRVAGRVNRVRAGSRGLLVTTERALSREGAPASRASLIAVDSAWADVELWHALRVAGERFTARHFLQALDLRRDADGGVSRVEEERRAYVRLFGRTLAVSLGVALLCLLLGYPLAAFIAHSPPKRARIMLVLVLVPFWTSLLVRTTSWIVLLQMQGVVNDLLVWTGLVGDGERLALVYNMTGTFIAMTHVLLPFMILPLYSVMRQVPPAHLRAAASLGAGPVRSFLRVYWPQTLPGVGAGSLLVFILAIGYYITPALVGGSSGQLISNMIAYHMQTSLNWGLAAALGAILLVVVLVLFMIYDRVVGADRLELT